MSNMSYCRFENTSKDLRDCLNNIHDGELSDDEERARTNLILTCVQILEATGYEVEEPNGEEED